MVIMFLTYVTIHKVGEELFTICREMRSPGGSFFPLCYLLKNSVSSGKRNHKHLSKSPPSAVSWSTGVCSYVQKHVIGALEGFSQFLAN